MIEEVEMPTYRHLELLSRGPVSRVRLLNHRTFCAQEVAELTSEWNSVVDRADCQTLFLDCSTVQFMGSEMLSKLILLQRRLKQKEGKLILCGLRPEVWDVLSWTKLDRFFEIKEDEGQVVAMSA
jgi:anti-anti-sigma factor